MTSSRSRAIEACAAGLLGAALGGMTGRLVGWRSAGLAVGAFNGLVGGWRQVYDWRSGRGALAFGVDSTWALTTTAAALFSHTVAGLSTLAGRPARYSEMLSRRQGRFVYSGGFRPRAGFVVTLGNVVSGAGDLTAPRRIQLVTDHEQVHINQARALGPAYPVVYGTAMATGAVVAVVSAALRKFGRGAGHGDAPPRLTDLIETYAYYCNPCEWWAYSRDGNWPPPGKLPGVGWSRPIVTPVTGGGPQGSGPVRPGRRRIATGAGRLGCGR
jgi:hypothetical protein